MPPRYKAITGGDSMTVNVTLATMGLILIASAIENVSILQLIANAGSAPLGGASPGPGSSAGAGTIPAGQGGDAVAKMTAEADRLSDKFPYVWGGGHGRPGVPSVGIPGGPGYDGHTQGFDCSGSVCAVLAAAGLIKGVTASGGLMVWGDNGPGHRVTVFANPVHTFMAIDGRFFGTGVLGRGGGPAWGNKAGPSGFVQRHPRGL